MGLDCYLAINKEGETRSVYLDRFYTFKEAYSELLWQTKTEFEDLLTDCYIDVVGLYPDIVDKDRLANQLHWLRVCQNTIDESGEGLYCLIKEYEEAEKISMR